MPIITVIVPAKDEEQTIQPLYEQLTGVLESIELPYEILFVDDGSQDRTFEVMESIFQNDSRVRVLRFWSNQGKSQALEAGFRESHGDFIVTIDADLQDDPHEIPELLSQLDEGFDLVTGWKQNRQDSWSKRVFSKIFNSVVSFTTNLHLHDFNCGLKVFRREVIEQIHLYGEMHRFVPVMATWYGFRVTEVPVAHHPRRAGHSKYGLERVVRGLLDFCTIFFLTHYRQRPSHFFGLTGLWMITLGLILFGMMWCLAGIWKSALSVATLFFGIFCGFFFLLVGSQCILTGLLSEMVLFFFRRHEPSYYINQKLG